MEFKSGCGAFHSMRDSTVKKNGRWIKFTFAQRERDQPLVSPKNTCWISLCNALQSETVNRAHF